MSAAAMRVAVIEEAANRGRACGVGFASTSAVDASNASTATGAAATERGAITSLAADRCGEPRLEEKGKKLYGYQCVGVILLGSPFSATHSPALADQRAKSQVPLASSSRTTTLPSLGAVSNAWRMKKTPILAVLSDHFFSTSP